MFRSLIIIVVALLGFYTSFAQHAAPRIKKSLQQFIDSLRPEQKQQVLFPFEDSLRSRWTNLPVGAKPRKGINISALSSSQRVLFHRLLSASCSDQGYLKITSIMHLDNLFNSLVDTLHDIGRMDDSTFRVYKSFQYGHGNYFISIFGSPAASQWGYKIEGHHVSVNVTCKAGRLFFTPFFVGAIPAELHRTEYAGWRVLGLEQDLGLKLFRSLSPLQKKTALRQGDVPDDIFTNSESNKNDLVEWGLRSRDMSIAQQKMADDIILQYLRNFPATEASEMFNELKNNKDGFSFGWIGSEMEEEPHYFVLNGKIFLLEFTDVGNHIHSILRKKGSEFGASKLKQ